MPTACNKRPRTVCLQRATNDQEQYAYSVQQTTKNSMPTVSSKQSSAFKPALSTDNGVQIWISVQKLGAQH